MTAHNGNELDKRNWSLVKGWLGYSRQQIEKIKKDRERYDRVKHRVSDYAKARTAIERITALETKVKPDTDHSSRKIIAIVIVTVLGSFFYARGAYLLFSALGTLAIYPSLMAGLGASFAVDWSATNALTNRLFSLHQKHVVQQAHHRHSNLEEGFNKEISDLEKFFLVQKIFHINDIENIAINVKGFPSNVLIAVVLNIIEYASALFIINQIFASVLEIPLYWQMVIGLLPVALTWAAANIKSQSFGLSDYYNRFIILYKQELLPPFGKNEEDWLEDQEFEDQKLDSGIQILISETINKKIPTANAAEYLFDRDYFKEQKKVYEYRQNKKISLLKKEYEENKAELQEYWEKESNKRIENKQLELHKKLDDIRNNDNANRKKINTDNFSNFIKNADFSTTKEKIRKECKREQEEAIQKIEEKLGLNIEKIKSEYDSIIKAYENEKNYAQEKYEEECRKYNEECKKFKIREDERKREADIDNEIEQYHWELHQEINEQFRDQ